MQDLKQRAGDIKICTLGNIKIVSGGDTFVDSSAGIPRKWSLFLVLYFHAHETLSVQYLIEKMALEQNEAPEQSLRMMIYRLRRDFSHLDKEVILTDNGGYTFNSDLDVWLDAAHFEKLREEGEKASGEGVLSRETDSLREAFELYNGPFMAGIEENLWILQQRKRFRAQYMEVVEKLTDILEEQEEYEKAEEILSSALKHCPLEGEIHGRMIELARESGNYRLARQKAEESVAFFRKNGLQIPDELQKHFDSTRSPLQKQDPVEFFRQRQAARDSGVGECGPLTLFEIYSALEKAGKDVEVFNFEIEGRGSSSKLRKAGQIFSEVMQKRSDEIYAYCRWEEGNYVALVSGDAISEERDPVAILKDIEEKFADRSSLEDIAINGSRRSI